MFSELYSSYYNAVAAIVKAACDHPLQKGELREIINENAFGESLLNMEPALTEERWQLLTKDGSTPIRHAPTMPLTTLQKRWLKAISLDPRIRLFSDDLPDWPEVQPLFTPEDICVFDRYLDGDPYEEEVYIQRFRLILDAIRHRTPLSIDTASRKGNPVTRILMPEYLEYSEKDDKFRLVGSGCAYGGTVNLNRILRCSVSTYPPVFGPDQATRPVKKTVELTVTDQRNALERVLMHFAHFEKEAARLEDGRYRITVTYEEKDETEMVIRVLSFGPMVWVTSPPAFVEMIKERLKRQKLFGK